MSSRKRRHSEDTESDSRPKQLVSDNPEVADRMVPKALEVIRREFRKELKIREWELDKIDGRLKEALRTQHMLRYAVISSYYGVRTCQGEWPDASNSRHLVHPAIAGLSRKKKPKKSTEERLPESSVCDSEGQLEDKGSMVDDLNFPTKVPRYIPPATKKEVRETTSPTRGSHTKRKYCIIVGNVSRWIPVDSREDGASHKWMVYARSPPNAPAISQFVSKVRFFLHSSYRPFDVVEVADPPFRLSRRGWGEFPIRVQVHFHNPQNKPINIIHHLVLDRTKSGLQALGAETIVEAWLLVGDEQKNEDVTVQQSNMAWEGNSQGHADRCLSDAAMGNESGSMRVNSPSYQNFQAEKRARSYGMSASDNVPSVFNECTLMSEADIKREGTEEESESSDDDVAGTSMNCHDSMKILAMETETSEGEPKVVEGDGVGDWVSIKEEPQSEEEGNVEEELVTENHVFKEEVVFCDVNQECLTIKEEVVIEDGCFPRPSEEDLLVDMSSCHAFGSASYVNEKAIDTPHAGGHSEHAPSLKVENAVNNFGGRIHLLSSEPITLKFPSSVVHGETKPSLKPTSSSNAWQGPTKGKSLLIKNPSIRPGISLLIQNPTVSGAFRTIQPTNHLAIKSNQPSQEPITNQIIKPSVDPKAAMFARNYSKLKKHVHNDQGAAVSHLLKALPIVTLTACDPAYKALHHYAASSLDEFFSWPLAKQRAAEWIRAGEVRKLLSAQGFSKEEDSAWTTKDIMMWARLRGYTPLSPQVPHAPLHYSSTEERTDVALNLNTTFSEPKLVNEWLSSFEGEKLSPLDEGSHEDEEIDVVDVGGAPKRTNSSGHQRVGLGARAAGGHKVILLGMEHSMGDLSRLVDELSRKIGVVASCPEEITPCVFYPAAQRVLVEAVKSFMNDLIRGSYSYALRRTSGSSDAALAIKVEDVRNAVLSRQEFDILTNEGLSVEPDDSLKWDGAI